MASPATIKESPEPKSPPPGKGKGWLDSPSFPFVAPLLLFLGMLMLEGDEDGSKYTMYALKTALVGALIVWIWPRLPRIRIKEFWLSLAVGVVGVLVWVGLEPWLVWGQDKHEGGFNPYQFGEEFGYSLTVVYALFLVRIFGATVIVPIAEELFWRGFLMRFLINPNADKYRAPKDKLDTLAWLDYDLDRFTYDRWYQNPLGQYRPVSFWGTTFAFSLVHGSFWVLAIIYAVMIGWLFCRTKSLGDAIFAHGVTNLLLGFYVIYTGNYWFW